MKERPILFNTEMVKAVLDGRKTQTRRVIKPRPHGEYGHYDPSIGYRFKGGPNIKCPYGETGDQLWVRESFSFHEKEDGEDVVKYVDGTTKGGFEKSCYDYMVGRFGKLRPSIHMPKWASRITLEITNIRVERVQEINESTEVDAEGTPNYNGVPSGASITDFKLLWDSINKSRGYGWEVNPWVWVIEFKRINK